MLPCVAGGLLNADFAARGNAMNVLTRTAFIAVIAVGMGFAIINDVIHLSVGSTAALIAGGVLMMMNSLGGSGLAPVAVVVLGAGIAVLRGAAFVNLYVGVAADIRSRLLQGRPASAAEADDLRVEAGARRVGFIEKTAASAASTQKWAAMR